MDLHSYPMCQVHVLEWPPCWIKIEWSTDWAFKPKYESLKVLSNHSTRIALSNCSSVVIPVSLAWNIVFMTPRKANVACFAGVILLSVTTWKCHLCQVWHVKYVSHQECSHWYQLYLHWNELIVLVLNVVESQLCCQYPQLSMCSLQMQYQV